MRRLPVPRLGTPVRIPTDLYFIESVCAERHIKIGVSSNVKTRFQNMQMNCPYELRLMKLVPGAAHLEYEFHGRFAGSRLRGEWFLRTPELVAAIDELDGRTTFSEPVPYIEVLPWPMSPECRSHLAVPQHAGDRDGV